MSKMQIFKETSTEREAILKEVNPGYELTIKDYFGNVEEYKLFPTIFEAKKYLETKGNFFTVKGCIS